MTDGSKVYPQVIEKIEDWPISRLSKDREQFIEEINEFTLNRLMSMSKDKVSDLIAKTLYLERIRINEEPWKVDPPNERAYWRKLRKKLADNAVNQEGEAFDQINKEILQQIIGRYSEEIVGTFNIKTFLFARRFLTAFFNRLLNTAASRNFRRIWSTKHQVSERLKIVGHTDEVRALIKKGTVIIVPTHFSNLDSILIGYALDMKLGLPHSSYGAGLNLYNTGYTAYFMNRLGAYRVDRRKKNPVYLETLKAMSNLSIQRGTNSLFFPGGTRSRSGQLETKLKMGLLGTVVEAQRALCQEGKGEKIFVVPLILSYHFVLEAKYLIEQHLKRTGKEQYLDASFSRRKILQFVWRLFSESSDITLSVGQPMDVMGNPVNEDGVSIDMHSNELAIKDYFVSGGKVVADLQREEEYTKILADKIVSSYFKDNVVLSSHLMAFTLFNLLRVQNNNLDLYGILRLPSEDYIFPIDTVHKAVEQMKEHLLKMEKEGAVRLSREIHLDTTELIRDGVKNLGKYHPKKPLKYNKQGNIISDDFKLLYYYHNRLDNYGLEKVMQFSNLELVLAD